MDTNQFTQQLVEFASVQQQMNMNTTLETLISLQQTSETTSALVPGRRHPGGERRDRAAG